MNENDIHGQAWRSFSARGGPASINRKKRYQRNTTPSFPLAIGRQERVDKATSKRQLGPAVSREHPPARDSTGISEMGAALFIAKWGRVRRCYPMLSVQQKKS